MSGTGELLAAEVVRKHTLTPSICEFALERPDGGTLPAYSAGAHITVRTPAGPMRRYSLVGAGEDEPGRYVIAVKRERESRGGSASMHDDVVEGGALQIEPPQNDFPLKSAQKYLLIAGGIGITPIYAMAQRLEADRKDFSIVYCTRTAKDTAYGDEMRQRITTTATRRRSTTSGTTSRRSATCMSTAADRGH